MKPVNWILFSLAPVFVSQLALATLGEPISSVQQNAATLKVAQKLSTSTPTAQYSVSEMVADGNTIKQYSNAEGIVFAVSWVGISKPDLAVLFGNYFNEYQAASNDVPKQVGVRSVALQTSKMVVRRGGRMRHQTGLAFIPSLVPANVQVEDLK